MTTTITRAITRALNHAIESCEGSPEHISAINKDLAEWRAEDQTELFIVARLCTVPVRIVQMRLLEAMSDDPTTDPAKAIAFGAALRKQISLGIAINIRV